MRNGNMSIKEEDIFKNQEVMGEYHNRNFITNNLRSVQLETVNIERKERKSFDNELQESEFKRTGNSEIINFDRFTKSRSIEGEMNLEPFSQAKNEDPSNPNTGKNKIPIIFSNSDTIEEIVKKDNKPNPLTIGTIHDDINCFD